MTDDKAFEYLSEALDLLEDPEARHRVRNAMQLEMAAREREKE